MKNVFLTMLLCLASHASYAATHHVTSHAPIGIMGDHIHHKQGEWMLSYRFKQMSMQDNRRGTDNISTADVLSDFMVSPRKMEMDMHMLSGMVGLTDEITLMVMVPYTLLSMDHINRMGMAFTTKSEGIGDVKASLLYPLYQRHQQTLILGGGVSLPTGSISKKDTTPMGPQQLLPYPMQLGSGTYDLSPFLTYQQHQQAWSFGSQLGSTLRLATNDHDYRLGHRAHMSVWGAHNVTDSMSLSLRIDGSSWGNINGEDTQLNPMLVPTARSDLRGGTRLDALMGINFLASKGPLKDHRLAIEGGVPLYQHLEGPQLKTEYLLTIGWQKSW
jgi:hypothetical protein